MRMPKNLGTWVLGIWLVLYGLVPLTGLDVRGLGTLMSALAIVAGLLLLRGPIRLRKGLGMLLLAVWLIVQGILPILSIQIPGSGMILAVLAIAAGGLLLLD